MFRTRFVEGGTRAIVSTYVPVVEVGSTPENEAVWFMAPLDLVHGPVCRVHWDPDARVLRACFHHAIAAPISAMIPALMADSPLTETNLEDPSISFLISLRSLIASWLIDKELCNAK
jgi:hypothetical protein